MKKTTLAIFICFFTSLFSQAQIANDDNVLVCPFGSSGGQLYAFPLGNDQVSAGNIDYASLDLDPSQVGIQSSVIVNGITFTADSLGFVTWSGNGLGSVLLYYSFSDDLGNTSNQATLNIFFDPNILVSPDDFGDVIAGNVTNQSVLMNDIIAGSGSAFNSNAVVNLSGIYPGFSMDPIGFITIDPTVPSGLYTLNYEAHSPYCTSSNVTTVTFNVVSPCWKSISMGDFSTSAIKSDGTLWSWGNNGLGELGIGNTVNSDYPIQVGTDHDWASIAVGGHHTLAIKSNGTLWAWGWNQYGQLGDGTTTDKAIPIQIGTDFNWKSVAADYGSSAAIKTDNTLWTWGDNSSGAVGNGNNVNQLTPVQITANNDWNSVSVGDAHMSAIKNNGTLWTWGFNDSGQLGNASNASSNIPIQTATAMGLNQWKSVSASRSYTLAIRGDGTLWAWGDNVYEQLADGTTTNKNAPIQVGTDSNWDKIAAGYFHRLATKTDGTLWAWGHNTSGELGDGTTVNKIFPVQIGIDNNWTNVTTANYGTSAAIKSDGSLWVWGANGFGQLGDGTHNNQSIPMMINCSTLGFDTDEIQSKTSVYPNPFEDLILVESTQKIKSIQIFDLNGREIFASNYDADSVSLNLKSFSSGLYFAKIKTNQGTETRKLIKK